MAAMATLTLEGHGGPKQSQTNLDFGIRGDALPKTQPILIKNNGNKQLNWSASITSGSNWLSLSPSSAQIAPNSQETITATAQTNSLGAGNYTANLVFKFSEGGGQLNEFITADVAVQ
jgi:hypothetical protein